MPAITDTFDDVDTLSSADSEGLLHSAALAGAQVRAVAEAWDEGVLDALATARPRAVVIVTGAGRLAARAAALVVAALADRFDAPLVTAPALPRWIGPLDVVVVAGDDAGDRLLADALARAARRRAELVVLAPLDGPLAEAAGIGRPGAAALIDLSPRLPVDPRFRFTGLVAGLLAVIAGLSAVRCTPPPPELRELADRLDTEAVTDHPGQESFHNQAKQLALRAAGQRCVWSGDTPAALAAGAQAAAAFFEIAGRPAAVADQARALAASAGTRVDADAALFYDPDFDDAPPVERPRLFLISTAARAQNATLRLGERDAQVITEESGEPEPSPVASGPDASDTPADLAAYLVIVARAQFAAAYLTLTDGLRA